MEKSPKSDWGNLPVDCGIPKQQDLQKEEEDFLRQLTADSGHHNMEVPHSSVGNSKPAFSG